MERLPRGVIALPHTREKVPAVSGRRVVNSFLEGMFLEIYGRRVVNFFGRKFPFVGGTKISWIVVGIARQDGDRF